MHARWTWIVCGGAIVLQALGCDGRESSGAPDPARANDATPTAGSATAAAGANAMGNGQPADASSATAPTSTSGGDDEPPGGADAADPTSTDPTAPGAGDDAPAQQAGQDGDDGQHEAEWDTSRVPDAGCLAGVDDYSVPGPFAFTASQADAVRIWAPEVPAGCKVPMIHFSNGTGAACSTYEDVIQGLASHGFLVLCYESTNTGNGSHGLEAFETALALYPDLADLKLGSAGHGSGGQGALVSLMLSEAKWGPQGFYAGFGFAPESGFGNQPEGSTWLEAYAAIRSPVFVFSGNPTDGLVSMRWVQDGLDALDDGTEAYHFSRTDLTHIPIPQDVALQLAIPWFRWKLLGDADACEVLKSIPAEDGTWGVAAAQNEAPCRDSP